MKFDLEDNPFFQSERFKSSIGDLFGFGANLASQFSYKPYQFNLPQTTIADPATGRPVYNLGTRDSVQELFSKDSAGQAAGIVNTTLQGATTGAKIGGPIGGAIGAGVGLIGGFLGKGSKNRRRRRARAEALEEFETAQDQFNVQDIGASQTFEAKQRSQAARAQRFRIPNIV